MKRNIFIALVGLFLIAPLARAAPLVPSLQLQMKKQETINKNYTVLKRKHNNQVKLQALKSNKKPAIKKESSSTASSTTIKQVKKIVPKINISPSLVAPNNVSLNSIQNNIITQNPISQPSVLPSSIPQVTNSLSALSSTTSTPNRSNLVELAPLIVDMNRVRAAWLSWYNEARTENGLASYSYDNRLDNTAYDWNEVFALAQGLNHHRRNVADSYYSYPVITSWFAQRGVVAEIISGATTTENVGYGYYYCVTGDCTDAMINSIRSTFNFFMSEKGKSYDAHYRSIMQPYFRKIGLSIKAIPSEKRYYLTVHYITEFK